MQYTDIRHTIKSGDLLGFSHVGWKTWRDWKIQAIRFFTKSEYCHVGIARVIGGRVFCLEAVTPKVRMFPLSKLGDFYHVPMDIEWTELVEEYALSIIGENYSQLQAIEAFFEEPEKDNLWQCCEYVKAVYLMTGVDMGTDITPTGIMLAAQKMDKPTFFVENPSK